MKHYTRHLLPLLIVLISPFAYSQSYTIIDSLNYGSGVHSFCGSDSMLSPSAVDKPISFHDSAKVEYTAGHKLNLAAGFSAHNFNHGGYFRAHIVKPPAFTFAQSGLNLCTPALTITVNRTSGTGSGSLSYLWSPSGETTSSITVHSSGTYHLLVTDSVGCGKRDSVVVSLPTALNASIANSTCVSCEGGSNGAVAVSATGGVAPYSYAWSSSGQSTAAATGLATGVHTATVTDSNGCASSVTDTLVLDLHNSFSHAIAINPNNIYSDFNIGDTSLWLKFTANSSALALKINKPINSTDTTYADLQSARLYSGSNDTSLILLGEWTPVEGSSGAMQINVYFSSLNVGSPYCIMLSRTNSVCAALSVAAEALAQSCGTTCDLVGVNDEGDGDFTQYNKACGNTEISFAYGCVPCWSCSQGTPQIGFDPSDAGKTNPFAMMWAQKDGLGNDIGEGIQTQLAGTLVSAKLNVMYLFHWKYRRGSQTPTTPVTINVFLTSHDETNLLNCNGDPGQPVPANINPKVPITTANPSASWDDSYTCIQSSDITSNNLDLLWIYPTAASADPAWADVDDVDLFVVDAALGDDLCICAPTMLSPKCAPAGIPNVTYAWSPSTGLDNPNISNPKVYPDQLNNAVTTYTLTITYNNTCSVTSTITVDPRNANCTYKPLIFPRPLPNQICSEYPIAAFYADPAWTSVIWTWQCSGPACSGKSPNINGSTITFQKDADPQDKYTISYLATNKGGCQVQSDDEQFYWDAQNAIAVTCTSSTCPVNNRYMVTVAAINGNGNYTYRWYTDIDLTQPYTSTGSSNPVMYLPPGHYWVKVDDDGLDCTGIADVVLEEIKVSFGAHSGDCTIGGSVTAYATPASGTYQFDWSPSPSVTPIPTSASSSATFLPTGTYTVTAIDQNGNSCSASAAVTITNGFSIAGSSVYATCNGVNNGQAIVTASGGGPGGTDASYSYVWTDGSTTTFPNSSSIASTGGTYTVTVTAGTNGFCTEPATVTVHDSINLKVAIDLPASTICSGGTITLTALGGSSNTYSWSGGGSTATAATFTFTAPTQSVTTTYTVTLTGTNASGCSGTATATVTVEQPSMSITTNSSLTICQGDHTDLTPRGPGIGASYTWDPSSDLTHVTKTIMRASPPTNTTYTVTGTDGICTATATVTITVNLLPTISVPPPDADICPGTPVDLTASGASTYKWSLPAGLSSTTGATVTAKPSSNTTYTVTGTDINGCTNTAAVTVSLTPVASMTINGSITACDDGTTGQFTYTASGPSGTYTWSVDGGTATINDTYGRSATIAVADAAKGATITVSVPNNGCTASEVFNIQSCCEVGRNTSYWYVNKSTDDGPFPDSHEVSNGDGSTISISPIITINGTFTVKQDLSFHRCNFSFGPGATIIVESGKLTLEGCVLTDFCDTMWEGIIVKQNGHLDMTGCIVEQAVHGVTAHDGSWININGPTFFYSCWEGIYMPGDSKTGLSVNSTLHKATFRSGGTYLMSGYRGGAAPLTAGTPPHCGIEINNQPGLFLGGGFFGLGSYPDLIFKDLSNGILAYKTNFIATNSDYSDIKNYCIHADQCYASALSRVMIENNTMSNSATGVWVKQICATKGGNKDNNILNNTMTGMQNGIVAIGNTNEDDPGTLPQFLNISANTIEVSHLWSGTIMAGISLQQNRSAVINVIGNTITMNDPGIGTSGFGIVQNEKKNKNTVKINSNHIYTYLNSGNTNNGITLTGTAGTIVSENDIHLNTSQPDMITGISVNDAGYNSIDCNSITCNTNHVGDDYLGNVGINISMSHNCEIGCNTTYNTSRGVQFNNTCHYTTFKHNTMNQNFYNLDLENSGVIDQQPYMGNIWGTVGSSYQAILNPPLPFSQDASSNQFTLKAGATLPTNNASGNTFHPHWFVNGTGTSEQACVAGCPPPVMLSLSHANLTVLDTLIAQDSLSFSQYNEQTRWSLRKNLYEQLKYNDSLMMDNSLMTTFYDSMQNSNTAILSAVQDSIADIAQIDSGTTSQLMVLASAFNQLDSLRYLNDSLWQSELSYEDSLALIATDSVIADSLVSLKQSNDVLDSLVTVVRNTRIAGAQSKNAEITSPAVFEAAEQTVNAVYLASIAKGNYAYSSDQLSSLYSIAAQCPYIYGSAVFQARSLLFLADSTYNYNDSALCYTGQARRAEAKPVLPPSPQQPKVALYPNPTNGTVTLTYQLTNSKGSLQLFNTIGQIVGSYQLNSDQTKSEFDVSGLCCGVFEYRVIDSENIIGQGKVIIIR